jgi:hypothetical protein
LAHYKVYKSEFAWKNMKTHRQGTMPPDRELNLQSSKGVQILNHDTEERKFRFVL